MRKNKFNKKVRFSYFLPYGMISSLALELSIDGPAESFCEYDPDKSMDERMAVCMREHNNRTNSLRMMEKYGYVECVVRKYGEAHWERIRMYRLTKAGLYLITNTPDDDVENERQENALKPPVREVLNETYMTNTDEANALRVALYEMALRKENSAQDAYDFAQTLLEAIDADLVTVLASETAKAKEVSLTTPYKSGQFYRAWRLANIDALFKANGYLTCIDRRPMPVQEESSQSQDDSIKPLNVPTFVQDTLEQWYGKFKNSYLYLDPMASLKENQTEWESTPAFYAASEIPGFRTLLIPQAAKGDDDEAVNNINLKATYNNLCYNFSGLAIGKELNYVVYHTRQVKTPWSEATERNSIKLLQEALQKANEETPFIGADRQLRNAIMVCTTVYQFKSLFEQASKHMSKRWKKESRVGVPYNTVNIIPVNHAGACQLNYLMETAPRRIKKAIIRHLLEYPEFTEVQDELFPLSYNKKPVLVAHLMDFQELYWAAEEYNDGREFYVTCYPEQVKFIKTIMPEVKFL